LHVHPSHCTDPSCWDRGGRLAPLADPGAGGVLVQRLEVLGRLGRIHARLVLSAARRWDILRGLKAGLIVGGASIVLSAVLGALVALAPYRCQERIYGMVRWSIEPSINAISTIILLVTTGLIYLADRLARET
jgi:hypothetical protein